MFLGSGTLIETVEARVKTLERILRDYISKKFTGYAIFRNDVRGIYISIAFVGGRLAACRSIDEGMVYEGIECCRIAMKYLNVPEGVIEVYDIPFNIIELDIVVFPLSRVEKETTFSSLLGAEVGIPRAVEAAPPLAPQPLPTQVPTPAPPQPALAEEMPPAVAQVKEETMTSAEVVEEAQQPVVQPTPVAAVEQGVAQVKPAEISISNNCIDPVALYMVLRSAQLLEVLANPQPIEEIVKKIKDVATDRKPSYGYVSGNVENAIFRALYDSQSNSIYIEVEKNGTTVCGDNALKEIGGRAISSIRIWILP